MAARSFGVLARCASALGALLALSACVDDGVSMHVICPIFPEIEDNVCTYDPAGETCVLEGAMNLKLTSVYKQSLRVQSGLKARERNVPPLGETNGVQVRSARVDIRLPNGARLDFQDDRFPIPYDVLASGYIPPASTGVVTVTLIPPEYAAVLRDRVVGSTPQVVLAVQLKGKTDGAETVEAGEYTWPVRLLDDFPNGKCVPGDFCLSGKGQDGFATFCDR